MRPICWIAAAALAAAAPRVPVEFEHAPREFQSRVAIGDRWIAYTGRAPIDLPAPDGGPWGPALLARRVDGTAAAAPVVIFRSPPGTATLASAFAPDGRRLYFESNVRRPADPGREDTDLWVVEVDRDAWGEPRPLGGPWATPFNEHSPTVDADGTLCINSARPDGIGENDVYCGSVHGEPPRLIAGVNTAAQEAFPSLAPAGDALVFASNRAGGLGGWDLYVTWCQEERWSRPHNLGPPINSADDEINPTFIAGQGRLAFTRAAGHGETRRRALLVVPFATRRLPVASAR